MPPISSTPAGVRNRYDQDFILQNLVRDDVGKSLNKGAPNAELRANAFV